MSEDRISRERALDASRSFIVQAPAGSGKTELLIQRFLKLLARVDSPEAVIAITFTKKAAGEMRARVLGALRVAKSGMVPDAAHEAVTFGLAREVLRRDAEAQWRLLENPARLRIQTIDALCASITRQMPWLARFGAPPDVTEKARDLYREAARNTLSKVATEEQEGRIGALSRLLLHLDNNFGTAEKLIAQMLEKRDQWLRLTGIHPDLKEVRTALEASLERLVFREVEALSASVPSGLLTELPQTHQQWKDKADELLTQDGNARKRHSLYNRLSAEPEFVQRLDDIRKLPPTRFDDSQWETMEAVVEVLPKAVAELRLVFMERGRVDFTELSLAASNALGHLEAPSDLALSLGYRIEHLLIDEFQDTSYTQYELVAKLTSGWEPGDGRTLFLVGDPMQSIYRFRQADVSLFLKAQAEGIGALPLAPLRLTANFRSSPAIIAWVNSTFSKVMPKQGDIIRGAVSYTPSVAARSSTGAVPSIHAFLNESRAEEAAAVVKAIEDAEGTVAILVRARSHLTSAITALREHGIPFQAIEIDQLGDRAVIQDLMALTFALLHLADRISWLAILRAPWCGLTLEDLHAIAGNAEESRATIWELLRSSDLRLTRDGEKRLQRILPELAAALEARGRVPLRTVVEQTWLRLGGPACVTSDSDLADAAAYFDLLEGMERGGDLANFSALREQVKELFAQPDSQAADRLQIMTIHKAKGLEFDTVILPGLGQRPRSEDPALLTWQEQQGDLLLAPIGQSGDQKDPIYDYLAHLERDKVREEAARLLYVAATRAREHLHLMGCVRINDKGELAPDSGSFVKLLWPVVSSHFQAKIAQSTVQSAAAQAVVAPRQIHRLPLAWKRPAPPPSVFWRRESGASLREEDENLERRDDLPRHAGEVVHVYLQRMASGGQQRWETARIEGMLSSLGVPPGRLREGVEIVNRALAQTMASERGRWILAPHEQAANEFELTGLVEGRVVRARIDRTFIAENGTRWIIDYKTATHAGGSLETFLENERKRFAPQLERYARLMAQTEDRPTYLGLYFPLFDGWKEWAAPTVKRKQASLFEG